MTQRDSAGPVIMLLGAGGQLGTELRRALSCLGTLHAFGRAELDLTNEDRMRERVRALAPAVIVNAAAYTRVDDAESEPKAAFAVNARAPGVLAEEAARTGALLVHYSTDYVFDGAASRPYRESDPPNPASAYGASKLAGEEAVVAAGGPHLILRTAWLYGPDSGFVRVVRRAARREPRLRFAGDQFGSPTWSRRVARTTASILAGLVDGDRFPLSTGHGGVYHLAGEGGTSRLGFARAILDLDRRPAGRVAKNVESVTAAEFAAPAPRPGYAVLDCRAIRERFGVRLEPWRRDLAAALGGLTAGEAE